MGEIVDVKPHEAEWNLDLLESLFDFYYVQPARAKAKRDAFNKKLVDAGKQPLKSETLFSLRRNRRDRGPRDERPAQSVRVRRPDAAADIKRLRSAP
jgi:hypothetical protein